MSRDEWNYDYLRNKLEIFSKTFYKDNLSNIFSTDLAFDGDKAKLALFLYNYDAKNTPMSDIKNYKIDKYNSIGDLLDLESFQLVDNVENFKKSNAPSWKHSFECVTQYSDPLVKTIFHIFKDQGYNIYHYKEEFSDETVFNARQRKAVYFSRKKQSSKFQPFEFNNYDLKPCVSSLDIDSIFYSLIPEPYPMDRRAFLSYSSLTSMPSLNLGSHLGFQDINIEGKLYVPFVQIDNLIIQTKIDNYVKFIKDHKPESNEVSIKEQYENLVKLVLDSASKHKYYDEWTKAHSRGKNFQFLDLSPLDEIYKPTI